MGLHKSDSIAAIVIAVSALLEFWGDPGRELLRFDRAAIMAGEGWRLVSGHFVHLGPAHLLMNAAGMVLVWVLFGRSLSASRWLVVIVTTIAGISGGFWVFDPDLGWFVGLSGLLHGLLAAGIVLSISRQRPESVLLACLVVAKLGWEQLAGPLPGSEDTSMARWRERSQRL